MSIGDVHSMHVCCHFLPLHCHVAFMIPLSTKSCGGRKKGIYFFRIILEMSQVIKKGGGQSSIIIGPVFIK